MPALTHGVPLAGQEVYTRSNGPGELLEIIGRMLSGIAKRGKDNGAGFDMAYSSKLLNL